MDKNRIIQLLQKLDQGTLSSDEISELRVWSERQDTEVAARYADRLDSSWSEVKPQIRPQQKSSTIIRRLRPWLAAAASVILIMTVYTIYISSPQVTTVYATAQPQTVELPDHSTVILDPGSSISYTSRYGQRDRDIELSGRAFFDVERDEDLPFVISTESSRTTVLGTSFYLSDRDSLVSLDVVEGRVWLEIDGGIDVIRVAEESIAYDLEAMTTTTTSIGPNDRYWHTGQLVFDETPLTEALADISALLDVRIGTQGEDISQCVLTSTFDTDQAEDIISILSIAYQADWTLQPDSTYIITNINCKSVQ